MLYIAALGPSTGLNASQGVAHHGVGPQRCVAVSGDMFVQEFPRTGSSSVALIQCWEGAWQDGVLVCVEKGGAALEAATNNALSTPVGTRCLPDSDLDTMQGLRDLLVC